MQRYRPSITALARKAIRHRRASRRRHGGANWQVPCASYAAQYKDTPIPEAGVNGKDAQAPPNAIG